MRVVGAPVKLVLSIDNTKDDSDADSDEGANDGGGTNSSRTDSVRTDNTSNSNTGNGNTGNSNVVQMKRSATPPADEEVDLDGLVDAPPETVVSPVDRLAQAFPGSQILDE